MRSAMGWRVWLVVGFVCVLPAVASAQSFGLRAGASGDPDQFYVGAHMVSGPVADRVLVRPNIELGFGDHVTLLALNMEFVYSYPFRRSPWSVIAGGGPAANVFVFDRGPGRGSDSELRGGVNALVGLTHRDGFFVEVKLGFIDSPSVKLGVGVTF